MITLIIQSCELVPFTVLSSYQCFLMCFMAENGKLAVLVYLAINLFLINVLLCKSVNTFTNYEIIIF